MIIATMSLSPAIDRTYLVDSFAANRVNRAHKVKTNIGGKGINIASMAKICGFTSLASGFLGGANGRLIETKLKNMGVDTDFVYTDGETRINIKIADEKKNSFTDVNESGCPVLFPDIEKIYKKTDEITKKCNYIHIGGSIPPGTNTDIYKTLIDIAKNNGAITMLDAEGEVFKKGIEAMPHIIKPNKFELELLVGKSLDTLPDICAAAADIMHSGVETVLVSLGEIGAIAVTADGLFRAYPLSVPVKSTVCAGDSFLMGFVYGRANGENMENSLKYAISFSAAKIQKEGTDLPDLSEFKSGYNSVKIEKIG